MTIKKRFILFLIAITICCNIIDVSIVNCDILTPSPVSITCKTEKDSYKFDESIVLKIVISSLNGLALEFEEMVFSHMKRKLVVKNPHGKFVNSRSEIIYRPHFPARWFNIDPDNVYIFTRDLQKYFPKDHYTNIIHTLYEEGTYQVFYESNVKVRLKDSKEKLWEGVIKSNILNIYIKAPSKADLAVAEQLLLDGNVSEKEKLRCLKVISNVKSASSLKPLLYALKDTSISVVIDAIWNLRQYKNRHEVHEGIKELLDINENKFVRSEAIGFLGEIGTKEAIDLIKSECRSRKERSYRAAVVILGNVGDAESIAMLQEIADNDKTDWVRERARESIQKIKSRIK